MSDNSRVSVQKITVGVVVAVFALATRVLAGGSGLNVAVVVNQNSTNSVELGNYYCEQRGVPPQNVLRLNWSGDKTTWTMSDFDTVLRLPLTSMLASRQLTNQIEVVLLSMDLPYRVTLATGSPETSGVNGTTAALFYGFKPDGCITCPAGLPSCHLAPASINLYAGSEGVFRSTPPLGATSNSWLVMMITASNLAQAKQIVNNGVSGDGTFPTQKVFLAKTTDVDRNVRYLAFDNAVFDTQLHQNYSVQRTNSNAAFNLGAMLGYQTGLYNYSVAPASFVPGAMADNLTSYGGALFEPNGAQAYLWNVLLVGAAASYGTVVEPCAYPAKFPSSQNYFYQARGFSIAECYYQSLTNPYQGILVGEPLAAPFARPCNGAWSNPPGGAVISGTTNLSLSFNSLATDRPVQQVDFFVDGQWAQTITNFPPQQDNILYVTLNGFLTNYPIPVNATLGTAVTNLVLRLNHPTYRNATEVAAFAHGDRIELQGLNVATPGADVSVAVSNSIGSATVLTAFIGASRTNLLDTTAYGLRPFTVAGALVIGDYLELTVTKTNGASHRVAVTNQSGSATFPSFVQSLLSAINAEPNLRSSDGVVAEDLVTGNLPGGDPYAQFNLLARSPGIVAAQLQAALTGSFTIDPTTAGRLDDNVNDLRPRNHLYLTAGLTSLNLIFPFDTTTIADGYHELTAVAYEGSHVRTQKRISKNVRIQNNAWSATLTTLLGGTNTALEATLQFAVAVNTNNLTKLELFSTGGALGVFNNVDSATFAIAASYLGIGLHPFYALVTRSDGQQYRTDTKWLRIVGAESPFAVSVLGPAPTLTWPASAGRPYQILSAIEATNTFTPRAAVTPTNSTGLWSETNNTASQRYYRVKTP